MGRGTKALIAFAVCIIPAVLYFATGDSEKPEYFALLEDTQTQLKNLNLQNEAAGAITALLARMPVYRELIAKNFGSAAKYETHIISIVHGGINSASDPQDAQGMFAIISSRLTRDYLLKLRPDVTASEMDFAERVSQQTRTADQIAVADFLHLPSAGIKEHADDPLLQDGELLYLKQNPKAFVTGAEDLVLCAFDAGIGVLLEAGTIEEQKTWEKIRNNTKSLRSYIALAKLVAKLRQNHGKVGAIVMGGGHKEDFKSLELMTGSHFVFYDAILEQ